MNIEILFRPPMRRWQLRLCDSLGAAGHRVLCRGAESRPCLAFGVGAALALERRLFGPARSLFDAVSPPDPADVGIAELVIALDGVVAGAAPVDAIPVLEPWFGGARGDAGLIAMITHGASPVIRVKACRDGSMTDVVTARVAIEDRDVLSRALDQVLARLISLVAQGVRRFERAIPSPASAVEAPPSSIASPLVPMARGMVRKVAGRLPGLRRGPNHWRIGYRPVPGVGIAGARAWPAQSFTMLADDGARFQADPVPFEHDGRTYLFFEDFPYATGKGVIGCVEINDDGTASPSRTVLEQPYHLSYPLIVGHGGAIYMLPEMSVAGRIQLFRADPFPDRWLPDRVLVDGVIAADATPVWHDGRWWMFAALSDDGGSSWDQLGLFHAPDLLGPWLPHQDNPVLVDAGAARPAGAMWHEAGKLMRVAQDCRHGYGRGLAICRVDRLDPQGYDQTVVARLGPPAGQGADGLHTLNRLGALEVVDFRYPRRPAIPRATGRG